MLLPVSCGGEERKAVFTILLLCSVQTLVVNSSHCVAVSQRESLHIPVESQT